MTKVFDAVNRILVPLAVLATAVFLGADLMGESALATRMLAYVGVFLGAWACLKHVS